MQIRPQFFSTGFFILFFISLLPTASAYSSAARAKYSTDAREQIAKLKHPTRNRIEWIRKHSELTIAEILSDMPDLASSHDKARQSRPSSAPDGALYADYYQESPVLIDYLGQGNVVEKMSFGVIYKYVQDQSTGKIVPHFVRAQVVSSGRSGFRTPVGEFNIDRRYRYYKSQQYHSEMDYAQFFIGGVAVHQAPDSEYPELGGPASHGCVRHHELDAEAMWNLIGGSINDGTLVNIKVYPLGDTVTLADGSNAVDYQGMGADVTDWLNDDLACTRRGETKRCTSSWVKW